MGNRLLSLLALACSLFLFASCGQGPAGPVGPAGAQGPQGEPGVSPPATTDPSDIELLVADENDYRLLLGQTALTRGLSCSLQTFASVTNMSTFTALATVGSFLLDLPTNYQAESDRSTGLAILPVGMQSYYKNNNTRLICQGQVVVTETAYYQFDLTSDDGSELYLDGSKLIADPSPTHGTNTRSASKFLRRGVHAFRFDYVQVGGAQSLSLQANGGYIPAANFYH